MRPTKAIVSLSAISANLETARSLAPQSKVMAVIKANAYGHGAVEVARELQDKVPAFAVAFFDEAVQLRDAGITRPILVLQGSTVQTDVAEAAARDFWLMLHSKQQVERVLQATTRSPVHVWVKLDTGMHRLGLSERELESVCGSLSSSPNVSPDMVLCTHLASAEELDNPMTMEQVNCARRCADKHGLALSIANSAGIIAWPQSHAAWNRPGYMLFTNTSLQSLPGSELVPAMSMQSEIMNVRKLEIGEGVGYGQNWVADKPSVVGTIPIGYGDGYPRHAGNGTPVLVNGQRVPLVGRVSMDMICVDLSGLENTNVGDGVELWGQNLSVNEVAEYAGTIGYEILAALTGRVPIDYAG